MTMFKGYSNETFEFFMAISFNNNADFFHANHDWYVRAVRGPSLDLAGALSGVIEEIDDALERKPDRVVSRINRDIRFSNDKSPYRDYIWLSFHRPGEERSTHQEFYFDISADGAGYGMGMYMRNKPKMNAMRRAIRKNPDAVWPLIKRPLNRFELYGDAYKRMSIPDEVPKKLRAYYPLKNIGFYRRISDTDLLMSPALVDEIARDYRLLAPFYRWFDALTPIEDA